MSDGAPRRNSIRRRVLTFLIPSLLLLVLLGAWFSYFDAVNIAASSYDRSLLDPALDMAENVRVGADGPRLNMLAQAQEALLYDREDRLVFQIRDAQGSVIAGSPDLAAPPALAPGERVFFDGLYENEPLRIAAIRSDSGVYVQVGETLNKRKRLIGEMLAGDLIPTLMIAVGSIGLAWMGVSLLAVAIGSAASWRAVGGARNGLPLFVTLVVTAQPLWLLVIYGQITGVMLGLVGLLGLFLARMKDVPAGIALGLLVLKPQIAGAFAPVVFLRSFRDRPRFALASLLTARTVKSDTAMTGEISLRGLVLPVGGIKEKVVAAAAAGLKTVILPARNRRDYEDIPEAARNKLGFIWAERVEEVIEAALEPTTAAPALEPAAE